MAIRYPLVLNGATIEELQPADSIDITSASISGDLTFTGTGARVKANFSDPIATNRLLFQTSTANSTTLVGIMPNGTGSTSGIYGVNSSTLTNASYFDLRVSGSGNDVRLTSDYYGAGTYLPITFYTGGLEQVRITANSGAPADFQFSQSGTRITGDFSNGTAANRVLFQTSTANSTTAVGIMPRGTGTTSIIYGTNSSTLTNASYFDLRVSGSGNDVRLSADYYGAGTYLPITFYTGGAEQVRIDTSGNVGIGTISPGARLNVVAASASDALRITQTGAGNALVVEDSANPDSTPFIVGTNGEIRIGLTNSIPVGSPFARQLQSAIVGDPTGGSAGAAFSRFSADGSGSVFAFGKSRGNDTTSFAIVSNGDSLGAIRWAGADGTTLQSYAAEIRVDVDGTPGPSDMPGRLVFSTTADGASSPTERMRIDNQGRIGIGGAPAAGQNFGNYKNITGATTSYGALVSAVVQSDVTSAANYYLANINTAAAAFSLSNARGYLATQGSIGASSSVTNQYGFVADSTLTGATNNYGFYSNIASGTGRWNFYAAGTADNYFAGAVGIGGLPYAGASVVVSKSITGSTAGIGIAVDGTAQSDVTNSCQSFLSQAKTAAAVFTLGNYYGFRAQQASFGAGSTITNQYGFAADSSLTGATNNFGFHSNIPSGSGRYNFYAAGNASNYFAGNVGIGGDASVALETFASATNWVRNNAAAGIPIFAAYRSNGTISSKTVVSSGDEAGRFDVRGFDGTNFIQLAQINFHVDGTPGTNDMPGRIVFQTTADGASSPTERMRISNAGNVGIGQTSPASRLHVRQDQDGTTRTIIQNRNGSGTPLSELAFITSTFDFSDNRYAYIQSGGGGSAYLSFGTSNAGAPTERMQIAANGYVGIGTAPAAPFHVQTVATSSTAIIANTGGTECFFILRNSVTTSNNTRIGAISADLTLTTGGTERMRVTSTGNIHGTSGTTAMTDGFFYIPSAAGAPSGVPTAIAGRVPMYYDTTNNNFYVYNGAWKKVLLA